MVNIKKRSIIIALTITFALLVTIIIVGIFSYNSTANSPLNISYDTLTIEVNDGEGFNTLLDRLDSEGLVRNKLLIKLNLKLNNNTPNIIAGKYTVSKDATLDQVINVLETEDISYNQVSVTIPEGYNIESIAKQFEDSGLFTSEEFLQGVKDYPLPEYVKKDSRKKYNLEGYLYPDTYFFEKDAKVNDVISKMVSEFESILAEAEEESSKTAEAKDIETLIIKASLVEREVKLPKERSTVASVIENRIAKGMKLEFCSTVNYVIGYQGHEILKYKDIEVDSPFNTYKNSGLPIGPIASPGKASIKAALNPENTDYLYFVLTEDNESHHFSKTIEEHETAKHEAEAKRKELLKK